MVEKYISKRVIFKKGEQKKFILEAKNTLHLTWRALSSLLGISTRNLIDWENERFSMTIKAVKIISEKLRIKIPDDVEIKEPYWYSNKGAKEGGLRTYAKYGRIGGDPESRNKKWHEWWEKKGKYKKHPILDPIPIKEPKKDNRLAEFVGVMLGDGGMTNYQVKITLNSVDDAEYAIYLENLIEKLFGTKPKKYIKKSCQALDIVVSRTKLVNFCTEKLGLKIGNKVKQQVDIPKWIFETAEFKISCVRGLLDTDGTIINHAYRSRQKLYLYKKIGFKNRSNPLLNSVSIILKDTGIKHRRMGLYDIRIEAKENVKKYFEIIGSHNPKHLNKYYSEEE